MLQNDISIGGSEEVGGCCWREKRGSCIQASRPKSYRSPEASHAGREMKTNGSRLLKRQPDEEEEEGRGISPCLRCPGKWGGETGKLELLLAAHSAQSPFLKSQHAGWLNSGAETPLDWCCSADTDSARKSDCV